jgi:hypothetical protein
VAFSKVSNINFEIKHTQIQSLIYSDRSSDSFLNVQFLIIINAERTEPSSGRHNRPGIETFFHGLTVTSDSECGCSDLREIDGCGPRALSFGAFR